MVLGAMLAFAAIGGTALAAGLDKPAKAQQGTGQDLTADKVTLCHKGKVTINVAAPAQKAHEAHGDHVGACATTTSASAAKAKKAKKAKQSKAEDDEDENESASTGAAKGLKGKAKGKNKG